MGVVEGVRELSAREHIYVYTYVCVCVCVSAGFFPDN